MKIVLFAAAVLLASCGIETIEYLPQPQVPSYLSQTNPAILTYDHVSGIYSSTSNFQGYEVYYKLYPSAVSELGFTASYNLANDVNLLASTPTKDYLVALGYQRMSSNDQNSGTLPLIGASTSTEKFITLDFTQFLNVMNQPNASTAHTGPNTAPIPFISGAPNSASSPTTSQNVFRTISSSSSVLSYPWFSDLYTTWTTATSDMSKVSTAAISQSTQKYEVDVFLVAYAFTPEQTIYSAPVPWGVISDLEVTD